jgi:hypothetical protein
MTMSNMSVNTRALHGNCKQITKQIVQQQLRKKPDVDKEQPSVELYCSEYRDQRCMPHSNNVKSYVFNGDELFFEGYPYSIELTQTNYEGFEFEKCKFYEAHEGTLIRVFNINGKWYTSTNRRLDAFNSKWAAKTTTFGIHFADAVRENIRALNDDEIFEDEEDKKLEDRKQDARDYLNKIYDANLDKTKKYMFLLEPCKEERIVCLTNSPRFFNIGVFDRDNNLSLDEDVVLDGYEVPKPQELVFEDMREMLCALDNIDFKRIQGFIAIQSEEGHDDKHFKILNNQYKYYFGLRDNTSSIRFRYLQLEYQNTMINLGLGTNQQTTIQTKQMLDDFCAMYDFNPQPIHEYIWLKIVGDLFQKYQQRYIRKMPDTSLTEKQDMMLKEIHKHFIESVKANNRRPTDKTRIMDILAMQKPSSLNQLIAEYEKKDKDAERERRMRDM